VSYEPLLRDAYRVLNEDRRVDPDLIAPDFVLTQHEGIVGTRGTFRGLAGAQAALDELYEGFDDVRFEPTEFEEHGDWVIVVTHWRTRVRGVDQETRVVHLWRMRDGRAVSMDVLGSRSAARAAMEQAEAA
jgi:ketosteroid isomerase-like protein